MLVISFCNYVIRYPWSLFVVVMLLLTSNVVLLLVMRGRYPLLLLTKNVVLILVVAVFICCISKLLPPS